MLRSCIIFLQYSFLCLSVFYYILCPFTDPVVNCNSLMKKNYAPNFANYQGDDANCSRVAACTNHLSLHLQSQSKVRFFGGLGGGSDLHRDFHSTPDLNVQAQSSSLLAPKCHRSQEDVNALNGRNGLPPPNHPPPPPPVGQVIKMNVGANVPDVVTPASVYDNMAHIQQVKGNKRGFPPFRFSILK